MKILFFTRRYYPEIGGVETHVQEVTRRLLAKGHTVTIVAEQASGSQLSTSDRSAGLGTSATVHRIPIHSNERQKKFIIWKWLWEHRELIKNADIIHCHDVFYWYMPFRVLYPTKKVYTTFHGYETVVPPAKNAVRIRKMSERLSRGNICVGDFIRKWYGTHPDAVTYGGVTSGAGAKSKVHRDEKLRILFVGRMDEDTGVEQYGKLLEILKRNKIEYVFKALGDGSLKSSLAEFGETPGFQPDFIEDLHDADIVFASSYLSMLNALAAKKLVVALYDNELKKDYLLMSPFAKYIIAEKSPEEAYKKIKHYILNPNKLKTLKEEESLWASTQTWDKVTELYLKLWKL